MGGSMHMFDSKLRFMGGYAIVGESCPIALGIAYAVAMRDLPEAVICFFGDGAVNQGTFHESLNMAGLWRLPLLFVCENNHYAIGTEIHRHSAVVEVFKRAAAYNIPAEQGRRDGRAEGLRSGAPRTRSNSSMVAARNSSSATPIARAAIPWQTRGATGRPWKSRLYKAWDPISAAIREVEFRYPTRAELAEVGPDNISHMTAHMVEAGHLAEADVETLKKEVQAIVEDAAQFALQSPQPTMEAAWAHMNCNRHHEVLI